MFLMGVASPPIERDFENPIDKFKLFLNIKTKILS